MNEEINGIPSEIDTLDNTIVDELEILIKRQG